MYDGCSEEILESTQEDEASESWPDHSVSDYAMIGGSNQGYYMNSRRMAINRLVQQLCREEDVGFVDLWSSFVAKEKMYMRDGLHLSGKGAGVFADGLKQAIYWIGQLTLFKQVRQGVGKASSKRTRG